MDLVDLAAQCVEQAGPGRLELGLMAGDEIAFYLGEARGQRDGLGAVEREDWRLHGLVVMFGGGSAMLELCDPAGAGLLRLRRVVVARGPPLTMGAKPPGCCGGARATSTVDSPATATATAANPTTHVQTHVHSALTTQAIIGGRQCCPPVHVHAGHRHPWTRNGWAGHPASRSIESNLFGPQYVAWERVVVVVVKISVEE